jgi:hypothetical protein
LASAAVAIPLFTPFLTSFFISTASAQLVTGFGTPGVQYTRYDVTRDEFPAHLASSPLVHALANDNGTLWSSNGPALVVWPLGDAAPTTLGNFTGPTRIFGGGFAWDSARAQLLGTGGATILDRNQLARIDTQTRATTLLRTFTNADISGLDYDPVGDRLIFTNNRSSGLNGRGVYALPFPYDSAAPILLAAYPEQAPGSPELDIDGVAVGTLPSGDRCAYLVTDEFEWIYRFNLTTNTYETPIAHQGITADRSSSGATWAPQRFSAINGDLAATITAPAPCSVVRDQPLTFDITVRQVGGAIPAANTEAHISFPSFVPEAAVSSLPPGAWRTIEGARVYAIALGAIAPSGSTAAQVTLTPAPAGGITTTVRAFNPAGDPTPANNAASTTLRARGLALPDAAGLAGTGEGSPVVTLASTVPGAASAALATLIGDPLDPRHNGLGVGIATGPNGARIARIAARPDFQNGPSTDMGLAHSPFGRYALLHVEIATGSGAPADVAGNPTRGVLVRLDLDADPPIGTIVARTGIGPTFLMSDGVGVPTRLDDAAINESGVVALVCLARPVQGGGSARTVVVRLASDGSSPSLIAEAGVTEPFALGSGVRVGSLLAAPSVSDFGSVALLASLEGEGVTPQDDRAFFDDDMTRLLAHEGQTFAFGALDAAGDPVVVPIRTLDPGRPGLRPALDPFHTTWIAPATLTLSTTSPATSGVDRVLLQGASVSEPFVLIQENRLAFAQTSDGPASDVEPLVFATVASDGVWRTCVRFASGMQALLAQNADLARTGTQPWTDAPRWASQPLITPPAIAPAVPTSAPGGFIASSQWLDPFAQPGEGTQGALLIAGRFEPDPARLASDADLANEALAAIPAGFVLREGERVVPDGTGAFASGAHVASFLPGGLVSSRESVLALVAVRSRDAADGCAPDDAAGPDAPRALVRIRLVDDAPPPPPPPPTCPACPADFDQDGGVTGADVEAFFFAFESGDPCGDTDLDGGITGADVEAFFIAFEAGGC